jgi:hypothetical protein
MQRLWVKLFGEGDYLIRPDRDRAKAVHIAFNIILEVPIGDWTQKWHSGIHCLNARLSRAKPIGAAQTIRGVIRFGSLAAVAAALPNVRFAPESRH